MTDLNLAGESYAHSLISAGHVDKSASWSFSADDGNALLGKGGDDWESYGRAHLGLDRGASDKTKARYKYPFAKGGTLYRSALIAIRQRAGQQNDNAIFSAAGRLLAEVDKDKMAEAFTKGFDTEVKVAGDRALDFTISTASVDRMGDSVAVDGWKLDRYKQNPVVLWAHDSSALPVGKAINVRVEGGALKAGVEFTPPGVVPLNDTILELYKGGYLNATSVGFLPLKWNFSEDPARKGVGVDFIEQELLEFSLVPIPANPDALIQARSAGLEVGPMRRWLATQFSDEEIAELAVEVAGRKDLFADDLVKRVNDAAGISILTRERQKRIEEIERIAKAERLRRKRQRELTVLQLR